MLTELDWFPASKIHDLVIDPQHDFDVIVLAAFEDRNRANLRPSIRTIPLLQPRSGSLLFAPLMPA